MLQEGGQGGCTYPQIMKDQKAPLGSSDAHITTYLPPPIFRLCNMPVGNYIFNAMPNSESISNSVKICNLSKDACV